MESTRAFDSVPDASVGAIRPSWRAPWFLDGERKTEDSNPTRKDARAAFQAALDPVEIVFRLRPRWRTGQGDRSCTCDLWLPEPALWLLSYALEKANSGVVRLRRVALEINAPV